MERKLPDKTFEMLFESSPDACLLIENNHFIDCNQAAVRILHAPSMAQVLNTHPSALSPEFQPDGRPSAEKADEMIAVAIRNGSHRFEWTHKRADGEEFPVEVSLTLIRHGGREIIYTVWRDITERKKDEKTVRDSYNLLNNIINFLPYPTFIIDHAGIVMFWNKAMEDMTHVKAGEIIGQGNYEYSLAFYGERRPILINLVSKDKTEIEKNYPRLRRDQENERLFGETALIPFLQRYLDGCASVLRNESGEVLGAIEIVRDITEEKNTQQELIRAREEALSAARVKSEFLANMSHEIRTPMNAIIGLSHLLAKTELDGKQLDYLNKVRDSAQHLLGIINDILDFSKIEAGKLTMEETDFDLEEVLDHVSNVVGQAAHKKGLELLFNVQEGIPVSLRGDPLRLGQILINLANNAIKFTGSGHVLISVELRSRRRQKGRERGHFKFSVKDTGIGIKKEQKARLFQSFSQADASVTRKYGGTGLGLAISKKIAGLMGGDLDFRSRYGKGSTFFFTLPIAIRQESDGDHYKQIPDLRGSKVLIVDDQEVSLEVLCSYMESMGFRVTTAQSGHEALGILESSRNEPFKTIIMDWKMPGLDGFETISMMKKGGLVDSSSMIVMVSAYSADEIKGRAAPLDIGGYLTKPVTQSRLFDTLMNIYGGKPGVQRGKRIENAGTDVLFEGRKVLLVEDNAINQQVAMELMESAGLKVDAASNGKEAIEMLGKGQYACVLMDIQMPVMDGFEATRVIRGIDKYKDLPVIAMTAHAMAGDRERCLEAGMNDHTPKPIDPEKFFKTLRRWLGGRPKPPRAGGTAAGNQTTPLNKETQSGRDSGFLPDTLPGINIEAALKLVAGNRRLLRNILLEFADSFRVAYKELSFLLEQDRMAEALRLIHTIKGTSGNIGAQGLQQAAIRLEKNMKQNGDRKIAEDMRAFHDELALVLGVSGILSPVGIGAASGPASAPSGLSKDETEKLRHLFEQLQDMILQNSFEAADFFENIMSGAAKGFLPLASEEMEALGKALNSFDYEGALGPMRAALEKLDPGKI